MPVLVKLPLEERVQLQEFLMRSEQMWMLHELKRMPARYLQALLQLQRKSQK